MKPILIYLFCFFALSCSETVSNSNSPTPKPTASPTPTKEETAKTLAGDPEIAAYKDYVMAHYKGWVLKGFDNSAVYPFTDLNITKGPETKVIKVQYKEYSGLDGGTYSTVSKVTDLDLLRQALDDAEERGAEAEQENAKSR